MRSIQASVFRGQLKASLFSRPSILAIASHYNRYVRREGCPTPRRYWSSCPLRAAQSGTALRGKQGCPLHSVALMFNSFSLDSKGNLDALNRFTSGRWLWGEQAQFAGRYVTFDMAKLYRLAASAIGSESCVKVVKISEGQYNKVFLLTMDDGREVIAKLPNPNAGLPYFTTASEVATMDFVRSPPLLNKLYLN